MDSMRCPVYSGCGTGMRSRLRYTISKPIHIYEHDSHQHLGDHHPPKTQPLNGSTRTTNEARKRQRQNVPRPLRNPPQPQRQTRSVQIRREARRRHPESSRSESTTILRRDRRRQRRLASGAQRLQHQILPNPRQNQAAARRCSNDRSARHSRIQAQTATHADRQQHTGVSGPVLHVANRNSDVDRTARRSDGSANTLGSELRRHNLYEDECARSSARSHRKRPIRLRRPLRPLRCAESTAGVSERSGVHVCAWPSIAHAVRDA